MQTDNQLIRRIKKKQDKKAADELIRRYYREIYAFTYRQTGERELALDLTQEILSLFCREFMRLMRKRRASAPGHTVWQPTGSQIIIAVKVIKRKNCNSLCNGKQRRKKLCVIWRSIWFKKKRFAGLWILSFPMSANGFAFFRKNALRRRHLRRLQRRWILRRVP